MFFLSFSFHAIYDKTCTFAIHKEKIMNFTVCHHLRLIYLIYLNIVASQPHDFKQINQVRYVHRKQEAATQD